MERLKLKIIHNAATHDSPRLCNTCAHGLVLRGEGMEFAYCGYMQEYVSVRVENCTRYLSTEVSEDAATRLLSEYTR